MVGVGAGIIVIMDTSQTIGIGVAQVGASQQIGGLSALQSLALQAVVGNNAGVEAVVFALIVIGNAAAEQVSMRASKAVELAGKDLDDETREIFYKALASITANLTALSRDGIPE